MPFGAAVDCWNCAARFMSFDHSHRYFNCDSMFQSGSNVYDVF